MLKRVKLNNPGQPGQSDNDNSLKVVRANNHRSTNLSNNNNAQLTSKSQVSNHETNDEKGERLPDTATANWILGLVGLSSVAGGAAVTAVDKKRKK